MFCFCSTFDRHFRILFYISSLGTFFQAQLYNTRVLSQRENMFMLRIKRYYSVLFTQGINFFLGRIRICLSNRITRSVVCVCVCNSCSYYSIYVRWGGYSWHNVYIVYIYTHIWNRTNQSFAIICNHFDPYNVSSVKIGAKQGTCAFLLHMQTMPTKKRQFPKIYNINPIYGKLKSIKRPPKSLEMNNYYYYFMYIYIYKTL